MGVEMITAAAPSRHHHGSHRHLLTSAKGSPSAPARIDAIVVPTARGAGRLREAIDLARRLSCALVAICSRRSSAGEVARLAAGSGVELLAIDAKLLPKGVMPCFHTEEMLAGTVFERSADTGLKRNLGLLLANLVGWRRIVFLDDDILVPDPEDLREAARLLATYEAVGLSVDGFPDNSVVCHAYREAGGSQDTFIGGGAMAAGPAIMTSFFPSIYNEDWFFLLDDNGMRPAAITGRVVQWPYDPYASERGARAEEFGDCLAEGIFWLLDHGGRIRDADSDYWRRFLVTRRRFIEQVIDMVAEMDADPAERKRITSALRAARGRNLIMSPRLCVDYLQAWRADRARWRRHVHTVRDGVPPRLHPEKALSHLGLLGCGRYLRGS